MKIFLSLILTGLILASSSWGFVQAEKMPQISAGAYVLYCADNSQVLLSSKENTKMGMASTTKIMTSLLTLEQSAANDKEVQFTREMIAEGSSMYLKVGDVVKLSDLAAGMMTVSGNDAANAAAIAIGGNAEKFATLMNERAKGIGMKNTNFVTPSGLSHPDHYSTAYDMALLMAYAMENEDFATLTGKKSVTVDFVKPRTHSVTYNNHNRLLSMYEHSIGGKTGYTQSTGRCLVTCAEYEGLRLIAVTLNDRNDWQDHISMYEYGFENFTALIPKTHSLYKVKVAGGEKESVTAYTPFEKKLVVSRKDAEKVKTQVLAEPLVFAPVRKGQVLGKVLCTLEGEVLLSEDLIAKNEVPHKDSFWLTRFIRTLFK